MTVTVRRPGRRVAVAAAVVLVLVAGYLAVVGVLRSRPVVLPRPDGPHPVGRVIATVPVGEGSGEPGRAVWVWYPAAGTTVGSPAEYVPDGWYGTLPPEVGLGWLVQDVHAVQAHAVADVAAAPGPLPVVLLLPGFESAPWMYTSIGEQLASHGYAVALLVPPTTPARVVGGERRTSASANDQPTPAAAEALAAGRAADLVALLDALPAVPQVGSRVDAGRAVFAGHSLGGAAAVQACRADDRCIGSVDLDGPLPLPGGASKQVLLVGADAGCAAVEPCSADGLPPGYADWLRDRRAATPPEWTLTITGAGHNSFGDPGHYFVAPPLGGTVGTGSIAPDRMSAVQAAVVTAAVDHFLRGGPDTLLQPGSLTLPELVPASSP
jgi:dienelactone hydrolase